MVEEIYVRCVACKKGMSMAMQRNAHAAIGERGDGGAEDDLAPAGTTNCLRGHGSPGREVNNSQPLWLTA